MLKYNTDLKDGSRCIGFVTTDFSKSMPFYITAIGHFIAGKGHFTERSDSDNYLIIYSKHHKGRVKIEDTEMVLDENMAVFVDCEKYHLYETLGDLWDHYWIHLGGSGAEAFFNLLQNVHSSGSLISDSDTYFEQFERFLSMPEILNSIQVSEQSLCMHSILNRMAKELLYSEKSNSKSHSADIETAAAYFREHYSEPLSIDTVAEMLFMSKYHFIRLFKQYIGMTPYNYLINYRISRSKLLLQTTELPVSEIAVAVGFGNVNNFTPHFKRQTGMTPERFRKSSLNLSELTGI